MADPGSADRRHGRAGIVDIADAARQDMSWRAPSALLITMD